MSRNQSGKNNPNYKENASYRQIVYCQCGKRIDFRSKKCNSCNQIGRIKSLETREKISKAKEGSKGYWEGKERMKNIDKHHIDRNRRNNDKSNFLFLTHSKHMKLHWYGYEYLVKLGLHREYVREFLIQFDVNPLSDDGKIVHHIDCNRENNDNDNLMFLPSRAIHTKLHQNAYDYLVKINQITNYIKWFQTIGETETTNNKKVTGGLVL